MQNYPFVTPDLYLAMFGLFAAIMVVRELVHSLRLRRARVRLTDLKRKSLRRPTDTAVWSSVNHPHGWSH